MAQSETLTKSGTTTASPCKTRNSKAVNVIFSVNDEQVPSTNDLIVLTY